MCYTVGMQTRVKCSCGWTRELSQFYAGKRIRCADCNAVLEVPGASQGFYSSMKVERELNRPRDRKGVWLPLAHSPQAHSPRPHTERSGTSRYSGNSIFFIMIAVIIALNIGRILQDGEPVQRDKNHTAPSAETKDLAEPVNTPKGEDTDGKTDDQDVEREDEF